MADDRIRELEIMIRLIDIEILLVRAARDNMAE